MWSPVRPRGALHWLGDEFSMEETAAKMISIAVAIVILITAVAFVMTLFSQG